MSNRSSKVPEGNPNVRVPGEPDSPQNKLRGELYSEAFDRMSQGLSDGRYFEVIAIADSVITDRIQSVTQTILHEEPEQYIHTAIGVAVHALMSEIKDRQLELDPEFISLIKEINTTSKWIQNRNEVTHGFVVVTPKSVDQSIEDRQRKLQETAELGARFAREITQIATKVIRDLKRDSSE